MARKLLPWRRPPALPWLGWLVAGLLLARMAWVRLPWPLPPVPGPCAKDVDLHEALLLTPAPAGVVFLGDSLTERWRFRPDLWARYAGPRAANLGVGSDRVEHVRWRVLHGEVKRLAPRVAVILAGTNNLGRNSPASVAEAVGDLASDVRREALSCRVVILSLPPCRAEGGRDVAAVNTVLSSLPDYLAVPWPADCLAPDGVHLTESGYRAWGEALAPVLRPD